MLTPDQMAAAMSAVRDQLLAVVRNHERDAHGGDVCFINRAQATAFLAHCLGVSGRPEVLEGAIKMMAKYEAECPGGDCLLRDDGPLEDYDG